MKMNPIKFGNSFASIFLVGIVMTFTLLKPGRMNTELSTEALNKSLQHLSGHAVITPTPTSLPQSVYRYPTTSPQPLPVRIDTITPLPTPTPTEMPVIPPEATSEPEVILAPTQPPPPPPASPPPAAQSASTMYGGYQFADDINPLTGLPVDNIEKLYRRPAFIKVSNYPRYGRPHAGLSFADIVFEYYIGEEANRFMGVYYSQDAPKIGPLRSGRLIDPQLVSLYQGILSYGNADPKVEKVIAKLLGNRAIPFSKSPCPPTCGKDTHSVAGVFVDSAALTKFAEEEMGVEKAKPELFGMYFDPVPPASDQYAIQVGVEYSFRDRGEWHYDPESGLYLRWIEAMDNSGKIYMTPLVDRLTGEQLRFANVILIFARYTEYAPTLHDVDIWNNFDGQRAVLFRDGLMIDASWQVEDHEHPIQFYYEDGTPLPLKPGNSWIVVAGLSSTLDQVEPGKWEMYFHLP